MTAATALRTPRHPASLAIGGGGAVLLLALLGTGSFSLEGNYLAFILVFGLVIGSLGLLTLGHLMGEEWLHPVRREAEAASLTAPLLLPVAVPLALNLPALFPWMDGGMRLDLPALRDVYLSGPFFAGRGLIYLAGLPLLAYGVAQARQVRRASIVGLVVLVPLAMFAILDWVLSRTPLWWSSLFSVSFLLSQLLAALALAILVSLLRPEHHRRSRLISLERALLTLALLSLWSGFAEFLIVWFTDLPHEAAWYLSRAGNWLWLLGAAVAALALAVVILVPPGIGRGIIGLGAALLLLHHFAYMTWLLWPITHAWDQWSWSDVTTVTGFAALWAGCYGALLTRRRTLDPP
ncbi:hypothetical protein [Microvirga pudoricolor]|uniref:hypothetical protein n=1 Tax=Microvirga pudoricolor TaxID=2778729 RepID=UPI001950CD98|nr:hypothetical protein [Microvirga pudoricolor]MBM6594944.1 hypothetical protein [Microvirga pudoricolor]